MMFQELLAQTNVRVLICLGALFVLFMNRRRQGAARDVSKITGLSRNAAYKARRRVMRRLEQLGSVYRNNGRLDDRLKQALATRPNAVVERSVAGRMEKTLWFQQEPR